CARRCGPRSPPTRPTGLRGSSSDAPTWSAAPTITRTKNRSRSIRCSRTPCSILRNLHSNSRSASARGRGGRALRAGRACVWWAGHGPGLEWDGAGSGAAPPAGHAVREDRRLPPVLEELGENLLRACPHQGILFTEGETDTQAAWYLRFSRGLRPDLTIVPFERWRGDSVLRNRVLRELKTRDPALRALSQSRAVC